MNQKKELTRAEEQIMQELWQLEKASLKDIINNLPSPKPTYKTVSIFISILETKGFASHISIEKTHQYYPLISKKEYQDFRTGKILKRHFKNLLEYIFSFFAEKKDFDLKEADDILQMIEKLKTTQP